MQQMPCLSDLKAGSIGKTAQFCCHHKHPCWKLGNLVEVYSCHHLLRRWQIMLTSFSQLVGAVTPSSQSIEWGGPLAYPVCNDLHVSPLCCRTLSLGRVQWWRLLRSHQPWSGRGTQPWWDSFCRREGAAAATVGSLDMTQGLCSYESCFPWERLKFSCCFHYF